MAIDQTLLDELSRFKQLRTVIVGIGNTLKADDAAGVRVCEQIASRVACEVIDAGSVPENYIHRIIRKKPQLLLVIDAIDFGAPAGTIKHFKPQQLDNTVISTHVLSPRVFADMITNEIDAEVIFIGIQPQKTLLGEEITSQIQDAVNQLADCLISVFPPS